MLHLYNINGILYIVTGLNVRIAQINVKAH